ncbi:hypothetical protein LZC95_34700 [Pendulispora brunnea]|uniref:Uncharacterized protein n=1 Tax=Pendulispora brunnea TaxID=2905690 RepID=A0ABZ2K329_9BACT
MIWQDGWARGWIEARQHDIILALELRGISIPAHVRRQIRGCSNTIQLEAWFIRAFTATTPAEVVSGDGRMADVGHLIPRLATDEKYRNGQEPQ